MHEVLRHNDLPVLQRHPCCTAQPRSHARTHAHLHTSRTKTRGEKGKGEVEVFEQNWTITSMRLMSSSPLFTSMTRPRHARTHAGEKKLCTQKATCPDTSFASGRSAAGIRSPPLLPLQVSKKKRIRSGQKSTQMDGRTSNHDPSPASQGFRTRQKKSRIWRKG